MTQPLTPKLAAREDVPQVLALLNGTFRTPTDEKTWEWYVYGNPFGATRVYLLVERETQAPAGVFAYTPVPLRIGNVPIVASSGHHLCLRPAYQGGAAFMALSREALAGELAQGVRLALGVPNRRSHQPQKVLLKWTDLCFLDCLYKLSPQTRAHSCFQMDCFTAEFDEFYARVTQKLDFCIEKNTAWMNWRFHERPGRPYTVYGIRQGAELAGYAVLKRWREPDGYTKAHILDLHACNDGSLAHLIAAAETYAADCHEINLWSAPGFPYRTVLEAAGFSSRETQRQPVIAKTLSGAPLVYPKGLGSVSYADADFLY
jgi:hypothetical protein